MSEQITIDTLMDQITSCEASAWMCDLKPSKVHDTVRKHMREILEQFAAKQRADAVQQLQRENAELKQINEHHADLICRLDYSNTYLQNATEAQSIGLEKLRAELAAVEADRDELRREVERLKSRNAELAVMAINGLVMASDQKDKADQLRARLDAACEWIPVAEAELKNSEPVIAWQNGGDWREAIHFHGRFVYPGIDEEIYGVTSIMRIKPPASAEPKP